MQLTKQSYEILEQEIPVRKLDDTALSYKDRYMQAMYKHIEYCGRVCYSSLDRITEDSAKKFVNGLIKSGHLSVLEHGIIYLAFPYNDDCNKYAEILYKYQCNPYSRISNSEYAYVTTTYRVIIENHWEDDLQYLCEPTKYHELRHTVLLHSCIHVYKDLTRHRKMSFSIESTRYCNYSLEARFGEMKFIIPTWCKYISPGESYWHDGLCYRTGATLDNQMMGDRSWGKPKSFEDENEWNAELSFIKNCDNTEKNYKKLIALGWKAQEAAEILPQCLAADVVMSGYDSDWAFVFSLRSDIAATGMPHPLVEELMTPLRKDFENNNWI